MVKRIIYIILIGSLLVGGFLFVGWGKEAEDIVWGVNFSDKHATALGLDWQEVYLELLEDLGAKQIKIVAYWDAIESSMGVYDFSSLDWQVAKAKEYRAEILLVMGMKVPRWPECHIPAWAQELSPAEQQAHILAYLKTLVLRYQNDPTVIMWQIENEPFFTFGDCPWEDSSFLKQEIALVRELDNYNRPVLISDSGEFSFWWRTARLADVVGITTYKKVWFDSLDRYITYHFPAVFYTRRAWLVNKLFGKKVIGVELQAEPWGPSLLYESPLSEQERTMNLAQFDKNITFARRTGLDCFYLWGAEWWYQRKVQGDPTIWLEVKQLLK